MLWDTHMHTNFSGDSDASPESMIDAAIQKGLSGICFTDHLDYDFPAQPDNLFSLDLDAYRHKILALRDEYKGRLPVCHGIEIGLQPHLKEKNNQVIAAYNFDFVIGSTHVVDRMDPYYPPFFANRDEASSYRRYFEVMLDNIKTGVNCDVYGHLDYIVRYGPNKNKFYSYRQYADIIDEILRAIITSGKGIEVNTGGFKYGLGQPNPCTDILKRYRELGGEILTLGADAHRPEHVAFDFDKLPPLLRAAGFEYFTVFTNRVPQFYKLPDM